MNLLPLPGLETIIQRGKVYIPKDLVTHFVDHANWVEFFGLLGVSVTDDPGAGCKLNFALINELFFGGDKYQVVGAILLNCHGHLRSIRLSSANLARYCQYTFYDCDGTVSHVEYFHAGKPHRVDGPAKAYLGSGAVDKEEFWVDGCQLVGAELAALQKSILFKTLNKRLSSGCVIKQSPGAVNI